MTPTQLRAFAAVVRLGSVKAAAHELEVSEAAVSMHVGQLRKEFGDALFTRTASGIAFTPGGLRLASRAVEILGLQDRTMREVSQAGHGRRVLRIAASTLFAEHAAPGLIELFASRAADLDVELTVRSVEQFGPLLMARSVDVAIGSAPSSGSDTLVSRPFLIYDVVPVVRPGHPLNGGSVSVDRARRQTWNLGPSAVSADGVIPGMLRRLNIPDQNQRIFQSDAAALEATRRSDGVCLAVKFAVAADVGAGRLTTLDDPGLRAKGQWAAMALAPHNQSPAAAELLRFITTPRATQAMVRGAGVHLGRFKPAVHVTLWS